MPLILAVSHSSGDTAGTVAGVLLIVLVIAWLIISRTMRALSRAGRTVRDEEKREKNRQGNGNG